MNRILKAGLTVPLAAVLTTACSDPGRTGGGGTIQPADLEKSLYVANTDQNELVRLDTTTGKATPVAVGQEPVRIARVGNTVYVSNRNQRSITVMSDTGTRLSKVTEIFTGAEPVGIVANEDKIYVAASIEGAVFEYDAVSHAQTNKWEMLGEPRGLALHPSGKSLYVGMTFGGDYGYIDLESGELRMIALPESFGFNFETGEEIQLARRVTGDPAISPNGEHVFFPALYIDNKSMIIDNEDVGGNGAGAQAPPCDFEVDPECDDGFRRPPGGGGGYSDKFNPVVVDVVVDGSNGHVEDGPAVPVSVFSFTVDPTTGLGRGVSGYPVSIAFSPGGDLALVAIEGANAVVALTMDYQNQGNDGVPEPGGRGGFMFTNNVGIATDGGPSGIAFIDENSAYVHARFDRTVQKIEMGEVRRQLGLSGTMSAPSGARRAPQEDAAPQQAIGLRAERGVSVAQQVLSDAAERGRRLFFSTANPVMSVEGSGVSCATCHFQGRNDGLTWTFDRGLRQTPSLAGDLSFSEPVGWSGDRPTVATDAMRTSQGLMGGQGLTEADTLDIQAFVNGTRNIDNPLRATNDERVLAGAEIFAREDVGCIDCHSGANWTNNRIFSMYGLEEVKVRPLNGLRATAPYLHDGSAATLRDVLERSRDGSMGDTSGLTDLEMDNLELFLLSL